MITPLPPAPLRSQPESFASDAEIFLSALAPFATEANALQSDVNAKQTTASAAATSAIAAQAAAEAASNASIWVSGTTYAVGAVRFSPITFRSYRRKTAGAGTTDPSADSTNWQLLTSLGDVDLSSTQTLTNKTHSTGSVWNGATIAIANGGTSATTAAGAITALGAVSATATQTIAGDKTFSGLLVQQQGGESQVIARKTGTGASDTYIFNNQNQYGLYDSTYGSLIVKDKGGGIAIGGIEVGQLIVNTIAGRGTGDIGTYAFLQENNSTIRAPGTLVAGSAMTYADAYGGSSSVPSGTWRCMGAKNNTSVTDGRITLWLRIS